MLVWLKGREDNGEIIIRLTSDDVSSEYSFLISGNIPAGYCYIKHSGQDVYFQKANGKGLLYMNTSWLIL